MAKRWVTEKEFMARGGNLPGNEPTGAKPSKASEPANTVGFPLAVPEETLGVDTSFTHWNNTGGGRKGWSNPGNIMIPASRIMQNPEQFMDITTTTRPDTVKGKRLYNPNVFFVATDTVNNTKSYYTPEWFQGEEGVKTFHNYTKEKLKNPEWNSTIGTYANKYLGGNNAAIGNDVDDYSNNILNIAKEKGWVSPSYYQTTIKDSKAVPLNDFFAEIERTNKTKLTEDDKAAIMMNAQVQKEQSKANAQDYINNFPTYFNPVLTPVATQAPGKLAPYAVKNSNTAKVVKTLAPTNTEVAGKWKKAFGGNINDTTMAKKWITEEEYRKKFDGGGTMRGVMSRRNTADAPGMAYDEYDNGWFPRKDLLGPTANPDYSLDNNNNYLPYVLKYRNETLDTELQKSKQRRMYNLAQGNLPKSLPNMYPEANTMPQPQDYTSLPSYPESSYSTGVQLPARGKISYTKTALPSPVLPTPSEVPQTQQTSAGILGRTNSTAKIGIDGQGDSTIGANKGTSSGMTNTQGVTNDLEGLPTASWIGAGVQGATALTNLGMALFNKPKYMKHTDMQTPGPITTKLNRLSPEEEIRQVKTGFAGSRKDMRGNMAGMIANAGAQGQATSQVYDKYNQVNTQIGNQETQMNYGSLAQYLDRKLRTGMMNQQHSDYVFDYNNRERDAYRGNINQSLSNLGDAGSQFAKDTMGYDAQMVAANNMGDPNYRMNWTRGNYRGSRIKGNYNNKTYVSNSQTANKP